MGERATHITATKLDQRLSLNDVPPELAELAHHLNQMLARLEEAFQRLSDFSSDIAHELRTPINNLMMQTQVALSRSRDAESYREILESNAEEYTRLARMIADMLFLAKADNKMTHIASEEIDLKIEVQELFEFYEALAEEKQVKLQVTGEAHLQADRLMLRRAISNLLSNALRYTPPKECILVTLKQDEAYIELAIQNPGSGIPAQHLPRLFERFYRVEQARQHSDGEGAGLGLAIVQAIVLAHHGEIRAESVDGVTSFSLRLPRVQAC
jgi:two-component system heavy metal sensor histidine kinase CusS